ncbi:hypothetical protein BC834DRAFT_970591 [Gloeopeniophorella convolvens]|nr:hypothetical protein BC834DRAFT_970591 [Gloeopeniophorella convolvens]
MSLQSCKAVGFLRQSLMILSQILVSVTLATRIIALYSNSRRIIILVLGSGFLLTGVSCWSLVEATGIHIASAWEAQALFDALVFVLTVRQTLKTRALHRTSFNLSGAGLVDIVWRDGALYFAIMGFANLANIFTFYLSGPTLKGVFSTPASCISVTMCSRLVLNLYKAATPDEATASLEPMTTVVLGVYVDSGTFNRVGSDLESTWSGDALTERPDEEVGVAW